MVSCEGGYCGVRGGRASSLRKCGVGEVGLSGERGHQGRCLFFNCLILFLLGN